MGLQHEINLLSLIISATQRSFIEVKLLKLLKNVTTYTGIKSFCITNDVQWWIKCTNEEQIATYLKNEVAVNAIAIIQASALTFLSRPARQGDHHLRTCFADSPVPHATSHILYGRRRRRRPRNGEQSVLRETRRTQTPIT